MAHTVLVYGLIEGPSWTPDKFYLAHEFNKKVIEKLPEEDLGEWPWINRSMFSIPNEQGTFRSQSITFGASYRNLEYKWGAWLDKFEQIIRQLCWWGVTIHTDFESKGSFKYDWTIDMDFMKAHWNKGKLMPTTEWTFGATGPRNFDDQLK